MTQNQEFVNLPRFLFGESMGAAICLLIHLKNLNHESKLFKGAILIAPMCKISDRVKPRWPIPEILTFVAKFAPKLAIVPTADLLEKSVKVPEKKVIGGMNPMRYGDGVGLYRTHLFRSPSIVACSPYLNKFIFQSDSDFITEWPTIEIIGANSLVAVQGAAHTRLKSFVTRAINQPDALRKIALMVQPRVVAVLKSWAQKGRILGSIEAKKVTFENICMLFASFEPGSVLDTLDGLFVGMLKGIRAYPINIPGTAYHRALQCRKKAEDIFRNELGRRKKNLIGENDIGDLMGGLINFKDEEGKHLSDVEVVDNILGLVVGGYESTALSITWALYYLAKYPNVLQKLREENVPLSKSRNGELITYEDISKLKYTNKVVEETIRMANVAAFVFRTASKDINYKGYIIPKGWKVLAWVRYLHTNPENFDDPMCFNPDRWNVPAKPGTFQVFGGGSRICVGNMLARLQVAIFLHFLSVGYKWELINPDAEMIYLPHPKPADGVEIAFAKLN